MINFIYKMVVQNSNHINTCTTKKKKQKTLAKEKENKIKLAHIKHNKFKTHTKLKHKKRKKMTCEKIIAHNSKNSNEQQQWCKRSQNVKVTLM